MIDAYLFCFQVPQVEILSGTALHFPPMEKFMESPSPYAFIHGSTLIHYRQRKEVSMCAYSQMRVKMIFAFLGSETYESVH